MRKKVILTYHTVDDLAGRIAVPPTMFERQIRWLADRSVRFVTVSSLLDHDDDRPSVAVTFDDGFASVVTTALPILARIGAIATVFPIANALGQTAWWHDTDGPLAPRRMLDERDVGFLATLGWEVASHGMTHRCVLDTARNTEEEARQSRARLGDLAGHKIRGFAYPQGCHNEAAAQAVKRAGYDWAVTTVPGGPSSSRSPFALQRVNVGSTTDMFRFQAMLSHPVQALRRFGMRVEGRHLHDARVQSTVFA